MPICKNNPKRHYTGKEPSPKGLGYCASGEEEGKIMKGRDGNTWIKKNGKWVKYNKTFIKKIYDQFISFNYVQDEERNYYEEKLYKKLHKWWLKLAKGNIIIIYKTGKHKLITSSMKTNKAQMKDITTKWQEFENDDLVEAIIWSAQSTDAIQEFINYIIKINTKTNLDKMIKMKDLPSYLLKNYESYFRKYEFYGEKDYHLKASLF